MRGCSRVLGKELIYCVYHGKCTSQEVGSYQKGRLRVVYIRYTVYGEPRPGFVARDGALGQPPRYARCRLSGGYIGRKPEKPLRKPRPQKVESRKPLRKPDPRKVESRKPHRKPRPQCTESRKPEATSESQATKSGKPGSRKACMQRVDHRKGAWTLDVSYTSTVGEYRTYPLGIVVVGDGWG